MGVTWRRKRKKRRTRRIISKWNRKEQGSITIIILIKETRQKTRSENEEQVGRRERKGRTRDKND